MRRCAGWSAAPLLFPYGKQILSWLSSSFEPAHDTTKKMTSAANEAPESAWASAQYDQSLRCPHEETLGP